MAILSNLLVNGESRLLGKLYTNDIEIGGIVNAEDGLHVGKNTAANANIYLNNKLAMRGIDAYLRINDTNAFTSGVYFGNSAVWTKGTLYIGDSSTKSTINNSSATIAVPATFSYTANANGNVGLKVNGTATITTGNITTANTNNIYNTGNIYNKNGRIETDVIRSNVWDIVSTQNLGGSFIVAPTIMIKDGSTVTITSVSGTTIVGSIKDTTNITSDSFGGHTWSQNSKIKITGKLTSGNNHYVLGTCDGTLTAKMNTTSNTINFSVTCNASTLPPNGTYTITGGTVMMYNVGGSNLVGIELTSYGTDKYTYIDIYNGSNGIKPVARLGKLDNLSTATYGNIKVNGDNLTGYGIYTNNGFFEGKIVSSSGKIGGFNIGTSAIYSTTNALGTTDNNVYIGTEGISLGTTFKVTKGGTLTATSGSIAGWRIESNYLASGTATGPGTDILMLSPNGTTSSYTIAGQGKTGWMITAGTTFGVNKDGGVYATSGLIGGFTIGVSDIHNGKTSKTETTNNGVWVGTDGIGFGKGITYFSDDGTGKIGPWTLSTTYLRNGNITGANNTTVAGVYLGTDGLNISGGNAASTAYIYKNGSNISVNIGNKLTWNGTTLAIDGAATIGGTTVSTVVSNASDGASAKSAIDDFGGVNLYRVADAVDGYLNSTPSSIASMNSTYRCQTSDWISVEGFSAITIQCWNPSIGSDQQAWVGYAFYTDKDMSTYISNRTANYGTAGSTYISNVGITVPSNAKYIRVSYRRFTEGYIKVERGSIVTDWSPAVGEDGIITSRVYSGLYGSANSFAGANFFFGNIIPLDYTINWRVKLRLEILVPASYSQKIDIEFGGYGSTFSSYNSYVSRTGSIGMYYVELFRAANSTAALSYGHMLGISLQSSTEPDKSNYARTINVQVLDQKNCTVTLNDSAVAYTAMPNYSVENYGSGTTYLTQMAVASVGQNATNNANNYDRLVHNNTCQAASSNASGKSYACVGSSVIGYVSSLSGYQTVVGGTVIDITYPILWATGNVAASATFTNAYESYPSCTLRNNIANWTGTTYNMAFLMGTLSGNLFTCDSTTPITSTVPTSANGKYYIPLGQLYSAYQIAFRTSSEVWAYQNGKFQKVDTVSEYITQINSDGIWVTPSGKKPTNTSTGAGATGTKIDGTNGVQIYDNGIKLAEYSSGIKLYQPNGTEVVNISTSGATFKGAINATSGFIGENSTNGFNISASAIYNPSTKSTLASDTVDGIYIGKDGVALGKGKFKVDKYGAMTSTSGTIGGWTVSDKYLYTLNNSLYTTLKKDGDIAFAAGSPDYNSGIGANLIIGHDGSLKAGKMQDIYSAGQNYAYSLQVYSMNNLFSNSDMLVLNGSGSLGSFLSMSEYYEDEDLIVHELYTQISRTNGFESEGYDYSGLNNTFTHYTQIYNGIIKTDGINNQEGQNMYGRKVFNNDAYYIIGNSQIITRFATKYTSKNSTGLSFMIANGYYAAGSDSSGIITDQDNSMYLCGGCDETGTYIRSFTTYNRRYTASANMHITNMGTIGCATSSSIRYKHDVEYYTNKDNSTIDESKILITKKKSKESPESILNIPIVTFKYNEGYVTGEGDFDYEKPILGLIAEDVAKICPECATYIKDDDGNEIPEAWDEKAVLVRLLYVVQKQNEMIKELQKEVQK